MRSGLIRLILATAFLIPLGAQASETSHATRWLDCWAEALGGRARLESIEVLERKGTFEVSGISGTFRVVNTASGQVRSDVNAGTFKSSEALDRDHGWSRMGDAPSHELADNDLARMITDAYMDSFSMFFDGRMEGEIAVLSTDADAVVLEIAPAGGLPIKVWLDPSTCLPVKTEAPDQDRTVVATIESWIEKDGLRFPHEVTQSRGDAKFDEHLVFETHSWSESIDESLFQAPEAAAAAHPRTISVPIDLVQNHVFVPVTIGDGHQAMFILDTGADFTVIEKGFAERAGVEMQGGLEVRGAGEASVEAALAPSPGLHIGGVEIPSEFMVAVPLGALSLREGRPIEGILGYDVTSRFVVEIDYASREVRFHPPADFRAPSGATAIKVRFDGNTPTIEGSVVLPDGREIEVALTLDTGNRSALIFHSPFAEREKVRDSMNLVNAPVGMGVGGATNDDLGRIKTIRIGPFSLERPLAAVSNDEAGANANPNLDGNVGGEILRRFTLWIDYANSRILLRPNAHLEEPFEFDMSGLLVEATSEAFDEFVVENVLEGSPAADAGLRSGDIIHFVNGSPVKEIGLEKLRAILRKDGETVTLEISRDGESRTLELTTRRMI